MVILIIGWTFSVVTDTGYAAVVIAVIIATLMSLGGYYKGDKVALLSAGAKGPIEKKDNAYVYRMVENLCIATGMPLPKIYIINDPAINAFATGRDPQHSSIALTTGAIKELENEELEGVIAHELSHIKNYDIRLMTIVIVLIGVITLLADFFIRSSFHGKRGSSKSNANGILIIVGIVFIILSPFIGRLIQFAISRKREFLADASGSLMTRYPEGLARALEKIAAQSTPLQRTSNATAHLYIANPFGSTKKFLSKSFSTHPPINERVKALRNMA